MTAALRGTGTTPPANEHTEGPSSSGLRRLRPALRVPALPSRLIGREREIAELASRLAQGGLVTLVGPPGVGKTRLCQELRDRAVVESADVIMCDLVEASGVVDLATTVARALDIDAGRVDTDDLVRRVAEGLRSNEGALLVLDNFEHLAEEASRVVGEWAREGRPMLVTSRHRLGLEGEACVELAPLNVSAGQADGEADAVKLFLDRFAQSHPAYAITPRDLAAVGRAVAELDGLPLAIELCAASATPPLEQGLAVHLEEAKTSLAESIEASWYLLTHEEKELLCHASVFRGGFEIGALAAVVGNVGAERVGTLAERLIAKSLLTRAGDGRLGMLAAIRDFACDRLRDSGGEADAFLRHAEHFADLGRSLSRADAGPEAESARRKLLVDADNFTVTHRRGTSATALLPAALVVEAALAIAAGTRSGAPLARALSSVDAALHLDEGLDSILQARALLARGRLLEQMGRPAEALGSIKLAGDLAASSRDPELVARALEAKGRAWLALGSPRDAREALTQAASAYLELGMRGHEARARLAIGDTWFFVDDLARAEDVYRSALESAQSSADRSVEGMATSRLAIVEMELGRSESALARYHDAIAIQKRLGDRVAEASASTYLAILEHDLGMVDEARARLETLVVVTRELGSRKQHGIASLYLGSLLVEVGDHAEAEAALETADRVLGEIAAVSAQAYARGWRAALAARAGDIEAATQALELARGHFRARREQSFYASAVELLAGHLDLARAAAAEGDKLACAAHRAAARRRLVLAPSGERAQTDVRLARRLLESALGVAPAPANAEPRPSASSSGALIVEPSGAWFRTPGGSLVDLSRRAPLRKLLAMLLAARLGAPGRPVATLDLMRGVWTDTRELAVLQNRLRVAIATLRKLGLASSLFTRGGGYVLDPRREVLAAE